MLSNPFVKIFNYLYLFIVVNYTCFVWYIFDFDYTGYGLVSLTLLSIIINYRRVKNINHSKPIVFWLIWVIYASFNFLIHTSFSVGSVVYILARTMVPFNAMSIVCGMYQEKAKQTLKICVVTFAVFTLLGLYYDSSIILRGVGNESIMGNYFANTICLLPFFLMLLNKENAIKIPTFLTLTIVVLSILVLCAVRKAFGAAIIFLSFWLISELNFKRNRTWLLIPVVLFLVFFGYQKFLKDSYVMERMNQLENRKMDLPDNAPQILSLVGDRAPHYYYGWYLFLENPIFGIGLEQANISNSRIHSEYMVELVENGIIGFVLFILFHIWLLKKSIRSWWNKEQMSACIFGGVIGLLFLYLTAWTWDFAPGFILIGVLVGYLNNKQSVAVYQSNG